MPALAAFLLCLASPSAASRRAVRPAAPAAVSARLARALPAERLFDGARVRPVLALNAPRPGPSPRPLLGRPAVRREGLPASSIPPAGGPPPAPNRSLLGKAWIAGSGTALLLAGLVLLFLPGPGSPILLAGLAVLAAEFIWARRLLAWTRETARAALRRFWKGPPAA